MLALPGVIFSLIFTSPNYFLIDTKENYDEADLIIQTVTKLDKGLQIHIKFIFRCLISMINIGQTGGMKHLSK